jgi:hypothetical protein
MFEELIQWPITSDRLQWHGRYVLRDLEGEPQILFRLTLTGTHFHARAAEPFIQIDQLRSRFVRIASDGLSVSGYFDHPPSNQGIVEFGYAQTIFLRCRRGFDFREVAVLRRALLPGNVRNVDRFAQVLG